MIAVSLSDVEAGYRGRRVLRAVTLEIPDRRVVGITGPNGSGKTTLLRVIQGLLPTTSGRACVYGFELASRNYRDIQRQTACVFQTLNVDRRLPISAGEVVMMGRYARIGIFGRAQTRDREIAQDSLERVDASHLRNRPYGQLSGGEMQRVNLARALAQQPRLLLLDEPTTFLDAESQLTVRQLLLDIHSQENLTMIVVSHDADMLAGLCEEIIVLRRGSIERVIPFGGFGNG
jgi:ABC-type cobalamin/Fe3+-siderophores transport system ATPase subunit